MPFRFTMEPILRLRASYERIERLRLLQITAAIVQVQKHITAAVREADSARETLREQLVRGSSGIEIQFEAACEAARLNYRRMLDSRLSALRRLQKAQQAMYRSARQKREILENLRERELQKYVREQARREQSAQDGLYVLRRRFSADE